MTENVAPPTPAELLRTAREKIVFFEWRTSELSAELTAAQSRCAAAEEGRARAEELARDAEEAARSLRRQMAQAESERARLSSLLSRPAPPSFDAALLEAERRRSVQLEEALEDARRELSRAGAERERWLNEMIAQARAGDEAPAALAQFISELRAEIIQLRAQRAALHEQLARAGVAPIDEAPAVAPEVRELLEHGVHALAVEPRIAGPSPHVTLTVPFARHEPQRASTPAPFEPPPAMPRPEPHGLPEVLHGFASQPLPALAHQPPGTRDSRAIEPSRARDSFAFQQPQARGAGAAASIARDAFDVPLRAREEAMGRAGRALIELCLRNLTARDPSRREQAAKHLASVPASAAAPALASALHAETEPKVRAQMARALVACGGEGAAEIVAQLQSPEEAPLVRMAAAEALSTIPSRAEAALTAAVADAQPAVRRRAAALAAALGADELLTRLCADPDASVRAAANSLLRAPSESAPPAPRSRPPAASARAPATSAAPAVPAPARVPSAFPARAPAAPVRSAEGPGLHSATLAVPAASSSAIAAPSEARAAAATAVARDETPVAPVVKREPAPEPERDEAIFAVRTSIFGLTEAELADRLGLDSPRAARLAERLIAEGRLARRGKRLIAAAVDERSA